MITTLNQHFSSKRSLKLKAFSLLSVLTFLVGVAPLQASPLSWAQSYGVGSYDADGKPSSDPYYNSGFDFPTAIAKMPDGGVVVAGQIDLPRLYAHGYSNHTSGKADATLVRFAQDGTILWQRALRQTNDLVEPPYYYPATSHITQMATDAQGNIFAGGYKSGNGLTTNFSRPFVAKFSPAGELIWQNGITNAIVTAGQPPQDYQVGVTALDKMGLTNDGGVVIALAQARTYGYSVPVIAKFNAHGALSFYKAFEDPDQYATTGPICQTADGSSYVTVIRTAVSSNQFGPVYGLGVFVIDASNGSIMAQRGWLAPDGGGEFPISIIKTVDGNIATLSVGDDGYGVVLRKFNADASATIFEKAIRSPNGVAPFYAGSLSETTDGGFLIGGHSHEPSFASREDAALMKVAADGTLEFVSLIGGQDMEGGPFSNGPSGAVAVALSDGGYALACTTLSYAINNAGKPDWWIVKTDASRHVRNYNGNMAELAPGSFAVSGSPQTPVTLSYLTPPDYSSSGVTSASPDFLLQDLGAFLPPDLPTVAIQASSPRIVSSRNAEAVVGQHFSYHVLTAFFPAPANVTFNASDLPPGFVINSHTGVISGVAASGTETATPLAVTLQATDGTDTAVITLSLTIGDGVPSFGVNGNDQPAYPDPTATATPVPGLADTVLTFTARYPGKPAGRIVTVQAATDPQGLWTDLDNGTTGYMTYEPNAESYVLGSTNYPPQNSVYFRTKVRAQGFADLFSNVVGPFNLSSNKARAGKSLFRIKRNGLRADFDFRATQLSAPADVALRVQSTKTPESEGSWTDLQNANGNPLPGMIQDDGAHYSLVTNNLPDDSGVYFRAIAAGSGVADSVSNLIGPYRIKFTIPPQVTITSPPSGGLGQSIDNPVVITANPDGVAAINIHATATAGTNRAISRLSILFDGEPNYTISSSSVTASVDYQKNITVTGDHVLEVLAFDDLGTTGRAGTGPMYLRVVPSSTAARAMSSLSSSGATSTLGSKVYHVVNSGGYWVNPTTWQDSNGGNGVPGKNDFAIIGSAEVIVNTPNEGENIEAGSVSINGGRLYGPGAIAINGVMTVGAASFDNDTSLFIRPGATLELLNSANLVFRVGTNGFVGTLLNSGTINVHGAGGLTGVSDFVNAGWINFQMPLLSSAAAAAALSVDGRALSTDAFHDSGKVSVQPLISNDGGGLITNDGGSLITNDGGSLIGNDGAGLITNDGGSLIGNDGAGLIGPNGGGIIAGLSSGHRGQNVRGSGTGTETGYIKEGGELDLNNLFIGGDVTLNSGVLSGTGIIAGNLTNNGGYIMPGHSPGVIAVTGSFTQASGGTMVIEAAGGEAGQFDQVQVRGAASLAGKLILHTLHGYTPLPNDSFSPLGYNSVSGSFASTTDNAQGVLNPTGLMLVIDPAKPNPPSSTLRNISTRAHVETGDDVAIGGFIISGSGSKRVIIRAMGPSLSNQGVPNALANPTLDLHDSNGTLVFNDDWKDAQQSEIEATGLAPANNSESAIVATLAPGPYTAIVRGKDGGTGVGLVEVYDLDSGAPITPGNISTRGKVGIDDNVMIGGFILGGNEPVKVLVRAIGPSLTTFGVADALQDPTLELHDADGNVITNDDWRATQEADIAATGLVPGNEKESAILVTLVPGNYTAIVRGKNGATGVALVEVFKVGP